MKQQVASVQKRIATGCRFVDAHPRWVSADNLHITLVFLGTVTDEQVPELIATADQLAAQTAQFELELARIDLFPPKSKRPLVISAGIGGEKRALTRLQEKLAQAIEPAGIALDQRSYKPHITLARLPSVKTSSRVQSVVTAHTNALQVKFQVSAIVLFESVTGTDGPTYVPINTARLAG